MNMPETDAIRARFAEVRAMVEHENELINHRLSWPGVLQGFLFASMGFLFGEHVHVVPAVAVCVVGVASGVSAGYGLFWSTQALRTLNDRSQELSDLLDASLGQATPKIEKNEGKDPWHSILFPWKCLPWVFATVWVVLSGCFIYYY